MSTYCEFLNPEAYDVPVQIALNAAFPRVIDETSPAVLPKLVEPYEEIIPSGTAVTPLGDFLSAAFPQTIDE